MGGGLDKVIFTVGFVFQQWVEEKSVKITVSRQFSKKTLME